MDVPGEPVKWQSMTDPRCPIVYHPIFPNREHGSNMETFKVNITDGDGAVVLELTATKSVVASNLRSFADELAPRNRPGRKPRGEAAPATPAEQPENFAV